MEKEKKEVIVDAARVLFAQFGFQKTTIDDITRKSRIAKSTLYLMFRSKEEIIEAVIEKEGNLLAETINKAINKTSDPAERIYLYILTRMLHIKNLANYYSVIKDEYLEYPASIEKARRKSIEWEINTVEKILIEGVEKKIFDVKNTKLTAFAIISSMKGLDFTPTDDLEIPDTEESIKNFISVLFNGIIKR